MLFLFLKSLASIAIKYTLLIKQEICFVSKKREYMDRRSFAKALGVVSGLFASILPASAVSKERKSRSKRPPEPVVSDEAEEQIKVIQAKRNYLNPAAKGTNGKAPRKGVCTSLLFFTDVHLVPENFRKIRKFYEKHQAYIDNAIHLGDSVGAKVEPPFTMWDSFPKCLNIMGNHDSHYDYPRPKKFLTPKEKYETFFKKYVPYWNVVQPENAEEKGLCFWYKDYNKDLRVVGIDCLRVDQEHLKWFEKVANDALEKKLKLVVITHIPPVRGEIVKCNFTSIDYTDNQKPYGGQKTSRFAPIIDKFIDNGGTFVSWVTGHLHHDIVNYVKDTKHKQLVITLECATDFNWWTDANHVKGTSTSCAWEIISVESETNVLKIARFGNNLDHYMRHKGALCYDFKKHEIISQY